MRHRDGDLAAATYIIVMLLIAVVGLAFALAKTNRELTENKEQRSKTSRAYCDRKMRSLGYQLAAGENANIPNSGQKGLDELCQSIRSAEAAEDSADYALSALFLVAIGTMAAGYAAYFARNAAKETKRQADVAEAGYRNLERPYVIETIESPMFPTSVDGVRTPPRASIVFRNYGREPAVMVQIAAHLVLSMGPPGDHVLSPTHLASGNDILVDGDKEGKVMHLSVSSDNWTDMRSRFDRYEAQLWVAGEFFYRDVRGRAYAVPFEWEYGQCHKSFIKRARPTNKSKDHPLMKNHMPPSFEADDDR